MSNEGRALINKCVAKGWRKHGNRYVTPSEAKELNLVPEKKRRAKTATIKTGWIDDSRNIANKAKHTDEFTRLIEIELQITVWPEFYFTTDRKWRFDYAIPITPNSVELKIAVEVEGGAWTRGRHTRPQGFINDMEKYNRATSEGWTLIRRTPSQLLTAETIDLIKKAVFSKKY